MNKGLLLGLGFFLVVAAIAVFMVMGQQKPVQTQQSSPSVASPATTSTDSGKTQTDREIVVTASEYSFSPSTINLSVGEETKITFKNTGKMPHNLVIDELNVSTKTIGSGQEDSITVKADKVGTYTFYCSVGNHRQLGMEGSITVK